MIDVRTKTLGSTAKKVTDGLIAIKQEETKNERAFQETLAKGEKELTGVINSHAEDLQSGLTAFGATTKEETIATTTSISNFTKATTTAFSAHVKVIDDAQASIASLADVVDEHELSTYDADGESPQKRERLDTSTILQVESDAEIRERKVPSRETTLDDNNSLDQSNQVIKAASLSLTVGLAVHIAEKSTRGGSTCQTQFFHFCLSGFMLININ